MKIETRFPDKAGCDLKPGDFIVYGHALGRCAGLQYGVVLEILPPNRKGWTGSKSPRIRVQGIDLDDNWVWERQWDEEKQTHRRQVDAANITMRTNHRRESCG